MTTRHNVEALDGIIDGAVPVVKNSVEVDAGALQLVGDSASPGNALLYGTDGVGARGFQATAAYAWTDMDSPTVTIAAADSPHTVDAEDYQTIRMNAVDGDVTATLPAAASVTGRTFYFKCIDSTNTVTVAGDGAETIDGSNTVTLVAPACLAVRSYGTGWDVV